MKNQYYYLVLIGSIEFSEIGTDDRKIRKIVAKFLKTKWKKEKRKHKGSIAYAINNGWYNIPPTLQIGRILMENSIVPYKPYTMIEDFPLTEESINEFIRVYE